MPIPSYHNFMLPVLELLGDKKVKSLNDMALHVINVFSLTEEEQKKLVPSGQMTVVKNRIGWSRTYLKKAGLIKTVKAGHFLITERGLEVLKQKPEKINTGFLMQFPEFVEFRTRKKKDNEPVATQDDEENSQLTPQEAIDAGYAELSKTLADDLLAIVKEKSPDFFEKLVVELLVKMGYGGSLKEAAGQVTAKSGDEGIDGIIKEDRLGLDTIYIQAKRWENPVGRPEIQKFVGALLGKGAVKGVFITTSSYTEGAKEYAKNMQNTKLILIDGDDLTDYMIEYNLGCYTKQTYEIKDLDSDYFNEE